jgi:Arc/MetJ-type ribon-helix-helix transcriptional regulator
MSDMSRGPEKGVCIVQYRSKRITFRLSAAEEERYASLAHPGWRMNWSEVIRIALRQYWDRQQKQTSDNGAGPAPPAVSDTRSAVRHEKKQPTRNMKRRQKSRKK